MITTSDLNISNKSYVNKDFASIYPELLDICGKITERWDPETSNESDPGVVLMKLAAFVADKNNYNLDKNLLESFMTSATQDNSMRRLCEMNGYNMCYYKSATVDVSFKYNGDLNQFGEGDSFTLPKYETTVVDSLDNPSVIYTLTSDCTIAYSNEWVSASAIEGTINTLTVNDSTSIQLSNLDSNNRLYLPEAMIAENGVFINDISSGNGWTCVDRLNTQSLGNKIYSFGYDSTQSLPYIEFPSDIASLIGSGLIVRYVITSGVNGNITAGTLTSIQTPTSVLSNIYTTSSDSTQNTFTNLSTNISVDNTSGTTNGSDAESVDDAYSNYKKVVGTFDTLVTCKDYANYIYNIKDDLTFKNIVSNIQVADRRNDFNYSNNVTTYEEGYGSYVFSNTSNDSITPYDLCLYPLKYVDNVNTESNYNLTFTPADYSEVEYNSNLTAAKCLSHNFKRPTSSDVYCFKNKYTLNVKLVTYDKLNDYQASLVVNNVKNALYNAFNSRKLEYGEAIPYNTLKEVIENADSRISSIVFSEPDVVTYVLNNNSNETLLDDASSTINKLAAKNILNGNISLFDFNDSYSLEFGQSVVSNDYLKLNPTYSSINHITTEARIPFNKETSDYIEGSDYLTSGYTLKANEVIQFITPNIVTETSYSTYVNYRFTSTKTTKLSANTVYKLTSDDTLKIAYTDSDTSVEHIITYTATSIITDGTYISVPEGNMFKPSFTLRAITDDDITSYVKINGEKYQTLASNQTLDKMIINKTVLNSPTLKCYWIRNNDTNTLFKSGESYEDIVLDDDEYFIYKNETINILGSGTRLSLSKAPAKDWTIGSVSVGYDDIISNGSSAFDTSNLWQNKNLSNNNLSIEDMTIYSYSEGDNVVVDKLIVKDDIFTDNTYVGNSKDGKWATLQAGVKISGTLSDGSTIDLPAYDNDTLYWQVRSRLDINCGPNKSQSISFNHLVTLSNIDSSTSVVKESYDLYDLSKRSWYDKNIDTFEMKTEYLTQEAGGENIDVALSNINADGITVMLFTYNQPTYPLSSSTAITESIGDDDSTLTVKCNKFGPYYNWGTGRGQDGVVYLDLLPIMKVVDGVVDLNKSKDEYILIYFDKPTDDLTVSLIVNTYLDGGTGKFTLFNSDGELASSVNLNPGINIVKLPKNSGIAELKINHNLKKTDIRDTLYIKKISVVNGYNSKLSNSNIVIEGNGGVLSLIKSYATVDGSDKFNYLNIPDNSKILDVVDLLDADAFWDYNNVANPFTIAQIDFNKSVIELSSSSKQ